LFQLGGNGASRRTGAGPHRAVVESTGAWYWLADALAGLGVELALPHPTRVKAIAAAKAKSDKVDSDTSPCCWGAGCLTGSARAGARPQECSASDVALEPRGCRVGIVRPDYFRCDLLLRPFDTQRNQRVRDRLVRGRTQAIKQGTNGLGAKPQQERIVK
jgi:hypothetical protein